jgi:hypothetical protein
MSLNRPTAGELLRAVAEHLEKVVQPRLSGTDAYQNRVALNLLRILGREAALGPELINEEQARLVDLLDISGAPTTLNEVLCTQISNGTLAATDPRLLDHLRRTVYAKMAIDNPQYAAYRVALARTSPAR